MVMKKITPHTSIIVCADEETMAGVLDRTLPYQKATNESPWRHIGELGEIAYMVDGSHLWKLWAGYEEMRLFLVYLPNGERQTHFAYIDDGGMLCNEHGDYVGWAWYDAEYYMDIPQRPSLPNSQAQHTEK